MYNNFWEIILDINKILGINYLKSHVEFHFETENTKDYLIIFHFKIKIYERDFKNKYYKFNIYYFDIYKEDFEFSFDLSKKTRELKNNFSKYDYYEFIINSFNLNELKEFSNKINNLSVFK